MATASGRAPVGLRNVGRDPSGFAVLNVFDLVVASVRDRVDLVDSQVLPSRCSRLREQTEVRDLAVDLLFGDQVVLGVDNLDVVVVPECIDRESGSVSDSWLLRYRPASADAPPRHRCDLLLKIRHGSRSAAGIIRVGLVYLVEVAVESVVTLAWPA